MVLGVARRSWPMQPMRCAQPSRSLAAKHRFIQTSLLTMSSNGQVRESAGFGVADDVLGTRSLTLLQLECGDIEAGLVGDERGVAEAFDRVEQRELCAGVRALAAHDQPGPFGPVGEVDEVGQLDHLGAVTAGAVGVDGWVPAAGRNHHDAVADAVIDVEPEGELEVAVDAFLGEPMRCSASICTDQHPMSDLARGRHRRRVRHATRSGVGRARRRAR